MKDDIYIIPEENNGCPKFVMQSLAKTIESYKKNMYSVGWQNIVLHDITTGQNYTLGEIDKLINN
jgi:hypothetical protein